MRQIRWLKLNETYTAVDSEGKVVGYIANLKQPPSKPVQTRQPRAV